MNSSKIVGVLTTPVVAFLSDDDKEHLNTVLENLCSYKKPLKEQIKILTTNLVNVRSPQELSNVSMRLSSIQYYVDFINTLIDFAGTQECYVKPTITQALEGSKAKVGSKAKEGLKSKLASLSEAILVKKEEISARESAHQTQVASQTPIRKSSHARKATHVRSTSNFATLHNELLKISESQDQLWANIAQAANDMIKHDLILKVIVAQINFLSKEALKFAAIDSAISASTSEAELDQHATPAINWLKQYDALLGALNKSLETNKIIGSILSKLIQNKKIMLYKELDANKDFIKKYLPDSTEALPKVLQLVRLLPFLLNIDSHIAARRKTLLDKDSNKNTLVRSNSESCVLPAGVKLMEPGVKIKFVLPHLEKETPLPRPKARTPGLSSSTPKPSFLRSLSSSKLSVKLRVKDDKPSNLTRSSSSATSSKSAPNLKSSKL